jgi:hypothetical protein
LRCTAAKYEQSIPFEAMHPIFMTTLRRPDLVAAHFGNYGGLLKEEISRTVSGLKVRAIGGVAALLAGVLALVFTGVGVMLGALHGFAWSLVLVPGCAWVIAGLGAAIAVKPGLADGAQELKNQVAADVAALRLAGNSHA